jgi:hypothetical protein
VTPLSESLTARLQFLVRVIDKEAAHLSWTDAALFGAGNLTLATIAALGADEVLAERVDAFVARFGRLQDTLGDKLLPALLTALDGHSGPLIDNLHRVARLGLLEDETAWLRWRRLRNQMVHDYGEDPAVLADALNAAHAAVPALVDVARRWGDELRRRGWAS